MSYDRKITMMRIDRGTCGDGVTSFALHAKYLEFLDSH